ncbi:tRNA (adenosine(37)-N6)-threonylcarbamoyltransferase complex dimerization subunit type 1 TsaB [Dictyoglomus thermophilum]|uniref:Glycoprotease family n=2 Tax=Dictyoglomus thermophilum TaxID=14 RepID=B5YDS6_DICT6|nr:tRNA (adenosine(37)-N6)-threonylcarbamoyltransferase complex dimerization subunit type 1 TsaB [Dictyoglomus thermophilum]ACI19717.1 glycoprotease family [Dictyoglomus thermophilum H-6-12]MCX7721187.1 tRNA (adenosine(37)-N6)-threonylcarbamoyltransferase complex dimerization subunit type 1 TsaB [Dictyoglomus thermophilum]TYT22795.1 tRNA (adenosine(37)-N6)-threonylcarbamoyltransferase complex dimerization subunit type 1 TsaB [Dictyoglomus thermophilum]
MFILGINTAFEKSSIILWKDNKLYELFYSTDSKTYGETLLTNLKTLLDISGWKLENIELYSIIRGPGSFTGLRIGIVAIKTLAQIYKKPIVGISYLECLAYQTPFLGIKVPIMPARKGELHAGFYDTQNEKIYEEGIYTYENFISLINTLKNKPIMIIGKINEDIKALIPKDVIISSEYQNSPRGETIIHLSLEKYKKGEVWNYINLLPDYRQKSSAEINWERKNANPEKK